MDSIRPAELYNLCQLGERRVRLIIAFPLAKNQLSAGCWKNRQFGAWYRKIAPQPAPAITTPSQKLGAALQVTS
jgi:hypothetical protein